MLTSLPDARENPSIFLLFGLYFNIIFALNRDSTTLNILLDLGYQAF
jgi:hypothetical protein